MASLRQWLVSNLVHGLRHKVGTFSIGLLYFTSQSESDEGKAQNDAHTWNQTQAIWSKAKSATY